jgi:hypothetical protein
MAACGQLGNLELKRLRNKTKDSTAEGTGSIKVI